MPLFAFPLRGQKPAQQNLPINRALCIQGKCVLIGNRETIIFDIGKEIEHGLLRFDIWCCGQHLNPKDNLAYPPSLLHSLKFELSQLQNIELTPDAFWFNFGEISDEYLATISLCDRVAKIKIEFNESNLFISSTIDELINLYQKAIDVVAEANT
ncbi:MAG: hypothetical protein ACFHVJ_15215 [Aestuariibacter sp.]